MKKEEYLKNYQAARAIYSHEFIDHWAENQRMLGSRIEPIKRLTIEGFVNDDPVQLEDVRYEVRRLITDDSELECSTAGIAATKLLWAATELVECDQEEN